MQAMSRPAETGFRELRDACPLEVSRAGGERGKNVASVSSADGMSKLFAFDNRAERLL